MALCSDDGSGFHTAIFFRAGAFSYFLPRWHSHPPELLFSVLFSPTTWPKETKSLGARMTQWPPFSWKQRMRHSCFRHGASIYPCRDYLLEVVSAPLKNWALVPHFFWDRYVYTSIIGSAVPKNCQYGAKNLPCRAYFFARVNGVYKCMLNKFTNLFMMAFRVQ